MLTEFEYKGKAMGTDYYISIICDSIELADKLFEIAKSDIDSYESRFTRFSHNSELSILNSVKSMDVSPEMLQVVQRAYRLYLETGGTFNPLVSISRLGYNKTFDDMKDEKYYSDEDAYNIDFSLVDIDVNKSIVSLKEGQNLDFGGMLKGYLAQVIADKIKEYSNKVTGVIVNLGGDLCTRGLDKKGEKFIFNIYNPISGGEDISFTLFNQCLATSGTYKKSWILLEKKVHHILDVTGNKNPNTNIISASVISDNGASAEAHAKVFLSVGDIDALKILKNKKLSYILIKDNGEIIKEI